MEIREDFPLWININNSKVVVRCKCGEEFIVVDEELATTLSETNCGVYADDFIELGQCPRCGRWLHV